MYDKKEMVKIKLILKSIIKRFKKNTCVRMFLNKHISIFKNITFHNIYKMIFCLRFNSLKIYILWSHVIFKFLSFTLSNYGNYCLFESISQYLADEKQLLRNMCFRNFTSMLMLYFSITIYRTLSKS